MFVFLPMADSLQGGTFLCNAGISLALDFLLPFFLPKETSGSPKFPSYPFEYMPWSKTPVVS